jgi:hypothetical protein
MANLESPGTARGFLLMFSHVSARARQQFIDPKTKSGTA